MANTNTNALAESMPFNAPTQTKRDSLKGPSAWANSLLRRFERGLRAFPDRIDEFRVNRKLARIGATQASRVQTTTQKSELRMLTELASLCPPNSTALEIGSYLGGSANYIVAGLAPRGGHLYCVDTWQNQTMSEGVLDTFARFQENTHAAAKWITPIRMNSAELTATDISTPLRLVFIDGDHGYTATKTDFDKVAPWVAKDGVVAFHDSLYFVGPPRVIGEALASGKWTIGGKVDGLFWIIRKSPSLEFVNGALREISESDSR